MNHALTQHKPKAVKKKVAWNRANKAIWEARKLAKLEGNVEGTVAPMEVSDGIVDIVTEGGSDAVNQKGFKVLAFLAAALSGSASAPVTGAGTTLLLAIDAPAAAVRALVISIPPFLLCTEQQQTAQIKCLHRSCISSEVIVTTNYLLFQHMFTHKHFFKCYV